MSLRTAAERILARCHELARVTDVPGQTTRLFLSPATRDAHTLLAWWVRQASLELRTDDLGTLYIRKPSPDRDAPTFLLFSHLDTVPNAGAFDGPLGVLLALTLLEELADRTLPFHVEILAFSEEEGIRFSHPFLSSLAATGQLTETHLARTDPDGITVAQAIQTFGLDPTRIPETCRLPANARAALEIHIEQGPVLEHAGVPLGVVHTIVGQSRLRIHFVGHANHAGTTPMALRQDALVGAALFIAEVESFASSFEQLVATVGRLEALPGAINIIPGEATLTVDVRHPSDASRHAAVARLLTRAEHIAQSRGLAVRAELLSEQAAVPMNPAMVEGLAAAAEAIGHPALRLFSGAGHDAMILAPHLPTAMLFVRSPGGVSHHPHETVLLEDVEAALTATLAFTLQLHL